MKQQLMMPQAHNALYMGWIRLTISVLAPALVLVVLISGI